MFGRERLNGYWKGIEKRRYDTRDDRNSQPVPHAPVGQPRFPH
jgi:hypothetical protein